MNVPEAEMSSAGVIIAESTRSAASSEEMLRLNSNLIIVRTVASGQWLVASSERLENLQFRCGDDQRHHIPGHY